MHDKSNWCKNYCSHGGICERDKGHEGLHDTGYCQWSDAESISYEEAQDLLARRSALLAMEWDLMVGGPSES